MILHNEPLIIVTDGQAEISACGTRESAELLVDLLQANVRFVHWKGNTHLLRSLEGKTDMEILVHPDDRRPFETILQKRSYKKLHSQPWNRVPANEDWLGFDYDTGNLLHLHTHYHLATKITAGKYLQLPWLDLFFTHLKMDPQTGWPVPIPELESIVLLVRIHASLLHDKESIPVKKQKELRTLLSQVQVRRFQDLCGELQLNVPGNMDMEINSVVQGHSNATIFRLSSLLYHQLPGCVKASRPMPTLKTLYYKYFLTINRYAGRFTAPVQLKKTVVKCGKMMALVGSDGSGKSTLCNDLIKWLTIKVDAHYFYFGKRPFIKSYGRTLFSKTGFLFNNAVIARYFKKLAGSFFYLLLIQKKIKMLRQGKRLSKKNSVVICDRFPQKDITGYFDGPRLQSKKNTWLRRLEIKQFNKLNATGADVVFRLNISPEVASRRKPEHDYKMIERKCMHLSGISFGQAKVVDVDAGQSYEQVLLDIKRKVWENL